MTELQDQMSDVKLKEKVEKSKGILRRGIDRWSPHACVVSSFGKDSTTMLHLVREVYEEVPVPVLFVDTRQHFSEIYEFKDRLSEIWRLEVVSTTLKKTYDEVKGDRIRCCHWLKTEPFLRAMKEHGWKACCIAIRWDENPARSQEKYIVKRENEDFNRIHPMLHWSERDVWKYIRLHNLPYCSLYNKNYRSVGCKPCTEPALPSGAERSGRAQDKEHVMEHLRKLGYF